eukprot:Nitzschia sp. Nitz4//scaffold80_size88189//24533//26194//NITZ4_005083-RA/size88189-processed-gene-0.13-mRNA-1//1//CDS//3329558618//8722//frame0
MSTAASEKASSGEVHDKDAVWSLLGLQASATSQADTSKESSKEANEQRGSPKDSASNSATPEPEVVPTNTRPNAVSPQEQQRQTIAVTGMERLLTEIGRKRKDHPVVDGQFDDASETDVPDFIPKKRKLLPTVDNSTESTSSPHTVPEHMPHPPHLIQQTSGEMMGTPHSLPINPELAAARQAAIARQATLFADVAPRFPPQLAGFLGPTPSDVVLLDRERRLQMEAMLNYQAHLKLASHPYPGADIPPHLAGAAPWGVPPQLHGLMPLEAAAAMAKTAHKEGSATPSEDHTEALFKARSMAAAAATSLGHTPKPGEELPYALRKAMEVPTMRPPPKEAPNDAGTSKNKTPTKPAAAAPSRDTESEESDHDSDSGSEDSDSKPMEAKSNDVASSGTGTKSRTRTPRVFSTKVRYEQYTPPTSWGELTKVPRMPHTPGDDKLENLIENIGPHDVLLGRGGLTNTNPGNIRFRALVSMYRMHYCTAPKGDKGALARYLCNFVRAKHGRFLQKDPVSHLWFEVGDDKAVMKCGQALREGTAELIRKALEPDGSSTA